MDPAKKERYGFLIRNILRGIIYLGILIVLFLFFKHNQLFDFKGLLAPILDRDLLVLGIYAASELFFGIIPPEFFMIWAAVHHPMPGIYASIIVLLAILSYIAAYIAFLVGKGLHGGRIHRFVNRRLIPKYDHYIQRFGAFIVIVAAVSPFPYAAISMLVGAADYSKKRYLLFSATRFIRFAIYSVILWETAKL